MFNEHGEANTTTNDIADETDISPGNLHYHFRKKSDLIDALIAEFQADVREVLQPPGQDESDEESAIDEFWGFIQLLIEVLAAYRFLIRDTETMVERYPQVAKAIRGFATALLATIELHEYSKLLKLKLLHNVLDQFRQGKRFQLWRHAGGIQLGQLEQIADQASKPYSVLPRYSEITLAFLLG